MFLADSLWIRRSLTFIFFPYHYYNAGNPAPIPEYGQDHKHRFARGTIQEEDYSLSYRSTPSKERLEVVHEESEKDDDSTIDVALPTADVEQQQQPAFVEDESQYPKSWRLFIIVVALCLAVFCMALDNTIIATAIPVITDKFKALEDVAWYGSAYLLTTCSFQLFFGRLYSFFSIKTVFLVAVGIFELGSLICGAAPSSIALIIGRAIAGLGSAGIFSGGLLIVAHTVPLRKRPIYIACVASMYGIASVAGPLLGGVFTDHLSWRWCFYINLPIGAVTVLFILLFFKSPSRSELASLSWKSKISKLDLPGTAIFIPAVVCLILALQWGGITYPWNSSRIIALFVVFGILLIIFGLIQWKQGDDGTVPPRIFLQRSVLASTWFAVMQGGSFFIIVYYVPIWFQAIKGTSATTSGIDSLPLVLAVAFFCVISGGGITLLGYITPFMIASSIVASIGCGLITLFKVDTPVRIWVGYQILAGIGFGLGIQNPVIVIQTVLPIQDISIGTAIIIFAQTLGGALFLAVAENVFLNEIIKQAKAIFPNFDVQWLFSLGATNLRTSLWPQLLPLVIKAYNEALSKAFIVSTALAALSIFGAVFVEWKSVRGQFLIGAPG